MWETCEECAFDGARWSEGDTITTLPILAVMWQGYLEGASDEVLTTRPDPTCWSIAEYTDHVREVLFGMRFLLDSALAEPGKDLGQSPGPRFDDRSRVIDVEAALDGIEHEGRELASTLAELEPGRWSDGVTVDGDHVDVNWIARHGVHDAIHHMQDVGRIRVRLGDGAQSQQGPVVGLHVSSGGVPMHVRIGDVVGEITSYATPCHKIARWFADGDFNRILHDRHPGWSRLYARVLRPGSVRVGDPVEIEPSPNPGEAD